MPRVLRQKAYDGQPRAIWEYHIPWAHHQHGDFVQTRTLDQEVSPHNRAENEPRNTFRQEVNIALSSEYGSDAYNVRDNDKKVLVARYGRPEKMVTFPSRNKYCGHHCLPQDSSLDSYHNSGNTNWRFQSKYGCCRCRLAEMNFLVPTFTYKDLLKVLGIDPSTVTHTKYGIPDNIMRIGSLLETGNTGSNKNGWPNKRNLPTPYDGMRYMHGALGRPVFFSKFTRLTDQFTTDDGKKGLHQQQGNQQINMYAGQMQFLMEYRGILQTDKANNPVLHQQKYFKGTDANGPYDPYEFRPLTGKIPMFAPARHLGWHAGLRRPTTSMRGRWNKSEPQKIVDLLGVISGSHKASKMCVHCRHVVKSLSMHLFWEARGYDHKTAVMMADRDKTDLKEAKAKYTPDDLKSLAPMLGATEQDELPARLEDK